MRCPNCGCKIPDGHLYCDECGAEIIIVPDFEPDIENEINSTLSSVADELNREDRMRIAREKRRRELIRIAKSRRRMISRIVFTVLAICFATLSISMYRKSSAERYLQLAEDAKKSGNYEVAISFLEEGYKKNPNNTDIIFRIADCYLEMGEPEQAVAKLRTITDKGNYPKQTKMAAYESIISIYKQTKEYDKIADILDETDNEIISELKVKYTSIKPEMIVKNEESEEEEGLRAPVVIELEPKGDPSDALYYTINGEVPDKNSTLYEKEIILEEPGEYNVKAVAFNSYGIPSVVVENDYLVEKGAPRDPEIMEDSGDYNQSTMIVVVVQDGCTVYYTTDGTEPTNESEQYTSPINMPVGTSNFRFIAYDEDGDCSEIVDREYHLVYERHINEAQAVNSLVSTLLRLGYILDDGGSVIGGGHNEYIYETVVEVPNAGEFYKIVENHVGSDGASTPTGNIYAVNTNDGTVNRLGYDSSGQYTLITISNR